MIKRSKAKAFRPAKKKQVETLAVWFSYEKPDGEYGRVRVGSAWAKDNGRLSIVISPLASWIGGDPEVNLTIFTEPYDGSSDGEEEDE